MNDRVPSTPDFRAQIADLHDKIDRILGMSAHAVMSTTKLVRHYEADQALDARTRLSQIGAIDDARKMMVELRRLMADLKREPSVTMVRDVPAHIEPEKSGRDDEWSLVHLALPGVKKKLPIPNRILWGALAGGGGAIGGWLLHWLSARGVHP